MEKKKKNEFRAGFLQIVPRFSTVTSLRLEVTDHRYKKKIKKRSSNLQGQE